MKIKYNESINLEIKIKETLTLFTFLMASSYYILWSYLNDIGRLELLSYVLDDKGTLTALIIFFIVLSLGLIFSFTSPSIILCQMCFLTWNNEFSRVINLRRIPLISFAISILYIISIISISFTEIIPTLIKDYAEILTASLLFLITLALFHLFSKKREKNHIFYRNGMRIEKRHFIKEKFIMSFFSLSSALFTTVPLLFILNISTVKNYIGLSFLSIISLILIALSFLPSMIFFSTEIMKKNIRSNVKNCIIISLSLFFIIMATLPNLSKLVVRAALKNAGIIQTEPHIYAFNKQKYTSDMFPPHVWTHINVTNEKYLYIKGTIIFSLGREVLICPKFVMDAQYKYKKYNLDNIFTPSRFEFQNKHLKKLTNSCMQIDSQDIKPQDGIIDGRNISK